MWEKISNSHGHAEKAQFVRKCGTSIKSCRCETQNFLGTWWFLFRSICVVVHVDIVLKRMRTPEHVFERLERSIWRMMPGCIHRDRQKLPWKLGIVGQRWKQPWRFVTTAQESAELCRYVNNDMLGRKIWPVFVCYVDNGWLTDCIDEKMTENKNSQRWYWEKEGKRESRNGVAENLRGDTWGWFSCVRWTVL